MPTWQQLCLIQPKDHLLLRILTWGWNLLPVCLRPNLMNAFLAQTLWRWIILDQTACLNTLWVCAWIYFRMFFFFDKDVVFLKFFFFLLHWSYGVKHLFVIHRDAHLSIGSSSHKTKNESHAMWVNHVFSALGRHQPAIASLNANHLNDGQLYTDCNSSDTHLLPFALLCEHGCCFTL